MNKDRFDIIPMVSVHPDSISIYNKIIWNVPHTSNRPTTATGIDMSEVNKSFIESTRKANGNVSQHAKRKMSRVVEYLVATTTKRKQFEPKLNKMIVFQATFLTLTLPSKQIHPDTEIINKCLNSFLIEIKKYHIVSKYIWRAEKQQNGNIHFHILTDSFIPYYHIRDRWNRIVNKLGYVDRYQEIHGNRQPNSTDIHSLRKIKNLKSYLTKYMTKDENTQRHKSTAPQQPTDGQDQPQEKEILQTGRIWGCSHNLSGLKGYQTEVDSEIESDIKTVIDSGKARIYKSDYFTTLNISFKELQKIGAEALFKYFTGYLFETLGAPYQTEMT